MDVNVKCTDCKAVRYITVHIVGQFCVSSSNSKVYTVGSVTVKLAKICSRGSHEQSLSHTTKLNCVVLQSKVKNLPGVFWQKQNNIRRVLSPTDRSWKQVLLQWEDKQLILISLELWKRLRKVICCSCKWWGRGKLKGTEDTQFIYCSSQLQW